jgi:hypothetical protein
VFINVLKPSRLLRRVFLIVPSRSDFHFSFFGCLVAGTAGCSKSSPQDALTVAAERGDGVSQYTLGSRFYKESGPVDRADAAAALKWFRRAAEQGYGPAEARLGSMYRQGRGVNQDYTGAARWLRKASAQGNRLARRELSEMYRLGEIPKSKRWTEAELAEAKNRRQRMRWVLLGLFVAVLLLFTFGLLALQTNTLTGWKRVVVAFFIHCVGIALLLNTLNTYTLELFLSNCSANFLAVHCVAGNPRLQGLVDWLTNWQMINLIFRFMAMVGLVLDALSLWYVWYLFQRFFRRGKEIRP